MYFDKLFIDNDKLMNTNLDSPNQEKNISIAQKFAFLTTAS